MRDVRRFYQYMSTLCQIAPVCGLRLAVGDMFSKRLARSDTSEPAVIRDYAVTSPAHFPHLQHWAAPTWDFSRVDELRTPAPHTAYARGPPGTARTSSANTLSQSPAQSNYDLPQAGAAGTPLVQHKDRSKERHTILRKPFNPSQEQQGGISDPLKDRLAALRSGLRPADTGRPGSYASTSSSSYLEHPSAPRSRSLRESRPKLVRQRPLQSDCLLPQELQGLHEKRENRHKERRLASLQETHTSSRDAKRARNPQKAPTYDPDLTESGLISHLPTTTTIDTSNDSIRRLTTLTCISCMLDLPAEDFSEIPLTRSCDHPNSACKDCVKQWIDTRLGEGSWNDIKCLECNEVMQYLDVQRHADAEVFQRYDYIAARAWVNGEESFVWCRSQGCGSGQVHEGGRNLPLFQCVACGSRYCIVHEETWHEGETCAAFDRRMNGEEPIEEGESSAHAAAQPVIMERERRGMTFTEANDIQDRRLYNQGRHHRSMTSDVQLARDFDAALALQYADDDTSHYESTFSRYRPPQSPAERFYFGPPSAQAPTSRRHVVQKFFNHRTREEHDLTEDPPPYIRQNAAQSAQDEELARNPQKHPDNDASYARSVQEEYKHYEKSRRVAAGKKARRQRAAWQCVDDASYARYLQKQFEQEDRNRRANVEEEFKRQRSIREANDREARRRSANDEKAARALQGEFEREDRARLEREAYRRRKAEEREGEQTVKGNAKQCPSCRWYIQKTDGCDHVSLTTPLNSGLQRAW